MVPRHLYILCFIFAVYAQEKDAKRDKRTVDFFLRGVGDVFGYDVIRRIPSPLLSRQEVRTPRPTFFPPAVGPLPEGSYSRIILQLQQQRQAEQNNLIPTSAPVEPSSQNLVLPQGAIVLPVASLLTSNVQNQNVPQQITLLQPQNVPQQQIVQQQNAPQQQIVQQNSLQQNVQQQNAQQQNVQQQIGQQQIGQQQNVQQQIGQQQNSQQQIGQQQNGQQQNVQQQNTPQQQIVQQPIALAVQIPEVSRQVSSTTVKPEAAQISLPWQIVALAPVVGQQQQQQQNSVAQNVQQNQAQTAPQIPQPTASLQEIPNGLNVSFDSGPTRLNLLDTPRAEAIRRTFNLNLNWNRGVEPVVSAPLVQAPIQASIQAPIQTPVQTPIQTPVLQAPLAQIALVQSPITQPAQLPQSAALVNQPQNSQIENFDIPPQAINDNFANLNLNRNQQLNEPSQRRLNADFRQSIRKFWETSPWNENLRSEDGKEQDNAQNYFDDVSETPKSEDVQEEESSRESGSSEETNNEVRMEERSSSFRNVPQKFRRRYRKVKKSVDAIKREKKSSNFVPEDEEKQVKGYYKRFVVSRKTRDTGSKEDYEPMRYTKDDYNHDAYTKDFSFAIPEEKEKHELEPEMEKFDVEADIPKKSKVRTKESKSGFNIVKITKKTKVIKDD